MRMINITLVGSPIDPLTEKKRALPSPGQRGLKRFFRDRIGIAGLILITLVVFSAFAAPFLGQGDPLAQEYGSRLDPPSTIHPLGTDELGRDVLSRVFFGGRISFIVGILSVAMASVVGVTSGIAAAYSGSWFDALLMRIMDAILVLPAVLWGVIVTTVFGASANSLALAVALVSLPQFARLARASAIIEAQAQYVEAARSIGTRPLQIMARHIFPNIVPPLIVQVTLTMAFAIQMEAGLSFLGLGVQPPDPSWGVMLSASRLHLYRAPLYAIAPGFVLALLLAGLSFMADAARRALDPRRLADIK